MNINVKAVEEKDIITVKALTLSQRTLNQLRELNQKELTELKGRLSRWIGYVLEPIRDTSFPVQLTWMLAMLDGQTLIKVKDSEYFWVMREETGRCEAKDVQKNLRACLDKLPQIFIS